MRAEKVRSQLNVEFGKNMEELLNHVEFTILSCGYARIDVKNDEDFFARDYYISIKQRFVPIVKNELLAQGFRVEEYMTGDFTDTMVIRID